MIADFHQYEYELCRRFLIPLLRERGLGLDGKSVLDAGCGYGGVLAGLAERFRLAEATGIDLDSGMIAEGRDRNPPEVVLRTGDFLDCEGGGYDAILMRDVLEHIVDVEGALAKAAGLLNRGGFLFASFAPFLSPFGGHQHNGAGPFASAPWLHLLPEAWFRGLLRFPGNTYKSGEALRADMDTVLRTRLSLGRFRRAAGSAGLAVTYLRGYAVRPDYRIKFGIPSLRFPAIAGPGDLFCTGVEALLAKP
jgi:SAM-dependent methyltransferase